MPWPQACSATARPWPGRKRDRPGQRAGRSAPLPDGFTSVDCLVLLGPRVIERAQEAAFVASDARCAAGQFPCGLAFRVGGAVRSVAPVLGEVGEGKEGVGDVAVALAGQEVAVVGAAEPVDEGDQRRPYSSKSSMRSGLISYFRWIVITWFLSFVSDPRDALSLCEGLFQAGGQFAGNVAGPLEESMDRARTARPHG